MVSTNAADGGAAEFPIADYGYAPEQLITFQMDMKEFSNPTGSETGSLKIEFYTFGGSKVGQVPTTWGGMDWPEYKKEITTEWATYRWQIGIPQDADFMKIVPVQHGELSIGYDNLAFVPNPSYTADTTARIVFGGDDGVVFKDYSVVVHGEVVVDPYSIGSISAIEEGFVITWSEQSGVTYDVEYKTSLIGGTWTKTLSSILAEVDGTVSATSTVQEAAAFFRVVGE